jgi:hypothetical protein
VLVTDAIVRPAFRTRLPSPRHFRACKAGCRAVASAQSPKDIPGLGGREITRPLPPSHGAGPGGANPMTRQPPAFGSTRRSFTHPADVRGRQPRPSVFVPGPLWSRNMHRIQGDCGLRQESPSDGGSGAQRNQRLAQEVSVEGRACPQCPFAGHLPEDVFGLCSTA